MTVVSAELGINHNGDLRLAEQMVHVASECGAGAVKVQAYRCEDFLRIDNAAWPMFEACQLSWDDIAHLREVARDEGVQFGATPTSFDGVQRLAEMDVDFLKNGADFLLRDDMIEAMAATGIPTWVSIGMASEDEVPWGLPVNFMACTSMYPCPLAHAAVARLRDKRVAGYSDHTHGTAAGFAAAALGAEMYERHFTLSKELPGPSRDHRFSVDPGELLALCQGMKLIQTALGTAEIRPRGDERTNRMLWRVREGAVRRG